MTDNRQSAHMGFEVEMVAPEEEVSNVCVRASWQRDPVILWMQLSISAMLSFPQDAAKKNSCISACGLCVVEKEEPKEITDGDVMSALIDKEIVTKDSIVQALAISQLGEAAYIRHMLFQPPPKTREAASATLVWLLSETCRLYPPHDIPATPQGGLGLSARPQLGNVSFLLSLFHSAMCTSERSIVDCSCDVQSKLAAARLGSKKHGALLGIRDYSSEEQQACYMLVVSMQAFARMGDKRSPGKRRTLPAIRFLCWKAVSIPIDLPSRKLSACFLSIGQVIALRFTSHKRPYLILV
eukprot:1160427-Pelagomonas_calceolata.AAC.9